VDAGGWDQSRIAPHVKKMAVASNSIGLVLIYNPPVGLVLIQCPSACYTYIALVSQTAVVAWPQRRRQLNTRQPDQAVLH
jgi:hypothetical protein